MTEPKRDKATRSDGKAGSPKRAKPTSDWLGFIRSHYEAYRTLPWGQQKAFIDKLARDHGQSANTLRRYIAAAEFLESFGVTRFPQGIKQVPVASVEAITRISKLDPARGRYYLDSLMQRVGTIRWYKAELADLTRNRAEINRQPDGKRISEAAFRRHISAGGRARWKGLWIRFAEWTGPTALFAKTAWPPLVVVFERDKLLVVFDEGKLAWGTSPAGVTREFTRNIALAATMFDAVLVYCHVLKADVERITAAMHEHCRDRIRIHDGILDFPIG
jgi:hypothetical protein